MMLGDLGAEIIKIEPPKGDPFRRFGRPKTYASPQFVNCNRSKRSVVLDLKNQDDQAKMLRLLDSADILLSNWRPAVAARLGLGDDVLAARNPRLIRVYVSGYGPTGPLSDDPVFDTIVQARSAMMHGLSSTDEPMLLPGYPVDKATAAMAAQAALAALYARERTGGGDRVDVAMLDTTAYLDFVDLFTGRTFDDGARPQREARNLHGTAIRAVQTADGWMVMAPVSSDHIRRACEAVGHPELADELLAERDQQALTRAMFDRLEPYTKTQPTAHWIEQFRIHDVPAGPCVDFDTHAVDPQVEHNRIYVTTEAADGSTVYGPRYPAVFASQPLLTGQGAAPALGADTKAVLGPS
jgi:crotonobetainyl-CoA:carnitine CoA-transferase CaiB-like acyl-CoA transferase